MIIKVLKAILAYFALRILIWSGGKEIVATAKEEPKTNGITMMQNQHLAGILLAMGCPPKEAEIRSEIFGFKDMPVIKEKLYWFKNSYWVDC